MGFSIDVDWSNRHEDDWSNEGRSVLENSCTHNTQEGTGDNTNVQYSGWCEECGISEDDCEPMMNYAYPLKTTPSDEDILKVVKRTCLTVMEKEGDYYLALCGGGMDLSQQIALSYVILENWIPADLLTEVCKQKGLSVGGEDWKMLRGAMINQLKIDADSLNIRLEEWKNTEE